MKRSHGILMSDEMVRQYLAGWKIMTRRTRGLDKINEKPDEWRYDGVSANGEVFLFASLHQPAYQTERIKPPYGYWGEELWFREAWAPMCHVADPFCECETDEKKKRNHYIEYRADTGNPYPGDWPAEEAKGNDEAPKWRSSMFMPKKYSRIVTMVTSIILERLQDIVQHPYEAKQEGFDYLGTFDDVRWGPGINTGRSYFIDYWNKLNAKRGMSWEFNPWVWVYEFPKYKKPSGEVVG